MACQSSILGLWQMGYGFHMIGCICSLVPLNCIITFEYVFTNSFFSYEMPAQQIALFVEDAVTSTCSSSFSNDNDSWASQLGGFTWTVPLGRRDSTTASLEDANSNLPSPAFNLSTLISAFSNKGFTANEMVALSGIT